MLTTSSVIRYLLFYMAVAVLYSLWSYVLDLVLIDNSVPEYGRMWLAYLLYFLYRYFLIAFLLSLVYNLLINTFLSTRPVGLRIVVAIFVGLIVGTLIGDHGINFYVGPHSGTKALVLYPLIGISVEILRDVVVRLRHKNAIANAGT